MDLTNFGLSEEYLDFISSRSIEGEVDFYIERHHILPQYKWPEYRDLKEFPWNMAKLTPEDHVEAHRLLSECLRDVGSTFAYQMMSGQRSEELSKFLSRKYTGLVTMTNGDSTVRVKVGSTIPGFKPVGGSKRGKDNHRHGKPSAMRGVVGRDHPCHGTKTVVNSTTGERKRVPLTFSEEGWSPIAHLRGAEAWETPSVKNSQELTEVWLNAQLIYEAYCRAGKTYGLIPSLVKEGIITRETNSVAAIIKRVKSGWVPTLDQRWLEFRNRDSGC